MPLRSSKPQLLSRASRVPKRSQGSMGARGVPRSSQGSQGAARFLGACGGRLEDSGKEDWGLGRGGGKRNKK